MIYIYINECVYVRYMIMQYYVHIQHVPSKFPVSAPHRPGRPPAAGHVTALPAMDPTAAAWGAEDVGAGHAAPGSLATSVEYKRHRNGIG